MARRREKLPARIELGEWMDERPEHVLALAEALLWIRRRDGGMAPLQANAAQRIFEQRCGRENVVLKARQMGMTTWIAARFLLKTMTRAGALTLIVAQSREAAESLFGIVRRMWEWLPEDLREGEFALRTENAGRMVFAATGSELRVASAADANAGRGLSAQYLLCSEVSRWPGDAAATLAGLRAALAPGGECVLESTPNGAYGAFYDEWRAATEAAGAEARAGRRAVRHFFPWWMEESYVGQVVGPHEMRDEEAALVERQGLTGEQIGFRRELEQRFGVLRTQEFAEDAETCFRATGSCCFDVAKIELRLSEASEPAERRRNGALWVWLPPQPGREYLVAVDTAGGGEDGDFAAVQIVERVTGLQCAELQERLRPRELARVVRELAMEYGHALVVVERNNHGAGVLAYLETAERYERIWRSRQGEPGWLTTASSKPEMLARLGAVIDGGAEALMSRRLLAECRTFVSGVGGSMGAIAGCHDDLVMSMALAQRVRDDLTGGESGRPGSPAGFW